MSDFEYVPLDEITRALGAADGDRHTRAALLAAVCRVNALYMIARAGSGHIGTTFSSTDIVCWLYLNELGSTLVMTPIPAHPRTSTSRQKDTMSPRSTPS